MHTQSLNKTFSKSLCTHDFYVCKMLFILIWLCKTNNNYIQLYSRWIFQIYWSNNYNGDWPTLVDCRWHSLVSSQLGTLCTPARCNWGFIYREPGPIGGNMEAYSVQQGALPETNNHMLQICYRTHRIRIKRRAVVAYICCNLPRKP